MVLAIAWTKRNEWIPPLIEKWADQTQAAFLKDTLEIEGFNLKNDLRVSIAAIRGTWQTEKGGFPFEVNDVELTDPLTHFIFKKPVHITFKQFRPETSVYPGLEGKITLLGDKAGTFELDAVFLGLYLEELTAFNPEILKGSSGKLTGRFHVKVKKSGDQELQLILKVTPPGGRLQARFFDVLLPYLPPADKEALELIRQMQTVGYNEAHVNAQLSSQDALKILLNIQVPEYNLNLNLNLTLRVEEGEGFLHLAQIMGLIKVENV